MMTRRDFVRSAAAAATAGLPLTQASAAGRGKRPNLIYVFADQLRYLSCGYAGDEYARTPNLDRLAAEGCNLHQAISSTPVCAPYRASLMTGKYQSSTGMVINELRLSPEHECFGNVLTSGGYQTAYIGKWHMWANQMGHHDTIRNAFTPPGRYRLGFDGFWAAYNFNHQYFHAPYFLNDADPHIRKQYEPDGQTEMAIEYLKKAAGGTEPFALFLSWGPPHYPWGLDNVVPEFAAPFRDITIPLPPNYTTVPDPYADDWQALPPNYDQVIHEWKRTYYAQTANLDWNLGRLLKAVDDLHLADDTIFVFTSDHGEMFGAHGRQAKLIFYEEAARVPFLLRWPGKIREKSVSDVLLGTVDIMPTLLTMLDLPVPKAVEGVDLSPHLLRGSSSGPDAAYMQGMGATAVWKDGTEWRAMRDHEYTYAHYHRDGKELLFDNRRDPFQMTDLASDRSKRAVLERYRKSAADWRQAHNDTYEACSWYETRWTQDRNITMTASGVRQDLNYLNEVMTKYLPASVGDQHVAR